MPTMDASGGVGAGNVNKAWCVDVPEASIHRVIALIGVSFPSPEPQKYNRVSEYPS